MECAHLYEHNPHGRAASNNQHRFSVIVWCAVDGEQLTESYIFSQSVTSDTYANVLQHELRILFENIPLRIRRHVSYSMTQHPLISVASSRSIRTAIA
jgi:hypothetical protein